MATIMKALYDYEGGAGELSFKESDLIEVVTQQDSGWWVGRHNGSEGEFPFNYVTMIDPEIAEQGGLLARSSSGRGHVHLSFKGSDVEILSLTIPDSSEETDDHGKKYQSYRIVLEVSGGQRVANKRYKEFRSLEAELKKLFPVVAIHHKLPSAFADTMSTIGRKSVKVTEKRRGMLENYLQGLISNKEIGPLLTTWLFPGEKAEVNSVKDAADLGASTPDLTNSCRATVVADWTPTDPSELRLEQGETITVLNIVGKEDEEGWWDGLTSDGRTGQFPSTYVEVIKVAAAAAEGKGDGGAPVGGAAARGRVRSLSRFMSSKAAPGAGGGKAKSKTQKHALSSCDAFDQLLDDGFVVEPVSAGDGAVFPSGEQIVKIKCQAMVWDAASGLCTHLDWTVGGDAGEAGEAGEAGAFQIGADEVVRGLDEGVQRMSAGERAMITMTPGYGFGDVGVPNGCPPGAHLVMDVTLVEIIDASQADASEDLSKRHGSLPVNLFQASDMRGSRRGSKCFSQHRGRVDRIEVVPEGSEAPEAPEAPEGEEAAGSEAFLDEADAVEPLDPEPAEAAAEAVEEGEGGEGDGSAYVFSSGAQLREYIAEHGRESLDATRLEAYLSDAAFMEEFGVGKDEFDGMPKWRRDQKKKAVGLF